MSLKQMWVVFSFVSMPSIIPWYTRSRVPRICLAISASYVPVDISCLTFLPFLWSPYNLQQLYWWQRIYRCCKRVKQTPQAQPHFLFFFASFLFRESNVFSFLLFVCCCCCSYFCCGGYFVLQFLLYLCFLLAQALTHCQSSLNRSLFYTVRA